MFQNKNYSSNKYVKTDTVQRFAQININALLNKCSLSMVHNEGYLKLGYKTNKKDILRLCLNKLLNKCLQEKKIRSNIT